MRENQELDIRQSLELERLLLTASNVVDKTYFNEIESLTISNSDIAINRNINKYVRLLKINKLVFDKDENKINKLAVVLNAIFGVNASVAVIVNSLDNRIDYYLGVISKEDIAGKYDTLNWSFEGNFCGSNLETLKNSDFDSLTNDIFDTYNKKYVSSVAGVADLNIEKELKENGFIQGLEKITDSMRGKTYTMIILAENISNSELDSIRQGYEEIYSSLYPFLKSTMSFSESDTTTLGKTITEGITKTLTEGLSKTQSTGNTYGESKTKSYGVNSGVSFAPFGIGVNGGTSFGASAGTHSSRTTTWGETNSRSNSTSNSFQQGRNSSEAKTLGKTIQINYENRKIKTMLDNIEKQLERSNQCRNFGCFNSATYIISDDIAINNSIASLYSALMKGENSFVENSVVNTWSDDRDVNKILRYLNNFKHPKFKIDIGTREIEVSPATLVNSKELAIQCILPEKSVQGLSVIQSATFGRNVFRTNKRDERLGNKIDLGKIYYMGTEEESKVQLDKKSLAMHTFVTGSTGVGKSNTVYQMIDQLNKKGVKFLVVEPAKGEYKNILGHRKDVTVLGTNNKVTKLLKINPFKFAKDIHVLEHIDQLVEIFNACWPMYAAMPAILKESIELAYEEAGWDLELSESISNPILYPTFKDVLDKLNEVIQKSEFSSELKGNYTGALATRVRSLTTGINRLIFCGDEIDNEILFDSNVIVDLSRVKSMETKSLIMGIIIMRLQEHRMMQGGMNNPLKHVTIIEEAHNILKKTSTEQSGESSNLLGKSVEMISNSIAEMRTYGEGFIIVDQSPNLLDMSAIKNTNTKIILRLPEQGDRELVGKSIGLSDTQISELAKLETGVACVYQNDWIEPVLCKINLTDSKEEFFKESELIVKNNLNDRITKFLLEKYKGEKCTENIEELEKAILKSDYIAKIKFNLLNNIKKSKLELKDISPAINYFYYDEKLLHLARHEKTVDSWNEIIIGNINGNIDNLIEIDKNIIIDCLLREIALEHEAFEEFHCQWKDFIYGGVR